MKRLAACVLIATMAAGLACSSRPHAAYPQKLVILGFDGMDPGLVERWMKDGKLPTFSKLAGEGAFHRLETTHAPETATAWASFATGVNPGKHGIFDLLRRDPATYVPDLAMVERTPARRLFSFPVSRPSATSLRHGTSFWVTAGNAGVRSSVLGVPLTFPPERVPNGELLSGFPLPDIAGAIGSFHYFGTNVTPAEQGPTELGGIVRRLVFERGLAQAELAADPNPAVPFTINWNHEARSATVEIQGHAIHLLEHQWSRWVEVEFRINLLMHLRGIVQFYLSNAGQHLQLYASPVHLHPGDSPAAMSAPAEFAREIRDRLGSYRTLGWPATAWALAEERLDESAFMVDVDRDFTDRAETILNRVDAGNWDLLVGVIDATDRVQHVMWRFIDPAHPMYEPKLVRVHGTAIERIYQQADRFVGELLQHLDEGTTLMIVSAYGFGTFRSAVHLNSWLVERGYMTLRQQAPPRRTLHDLAGGGTFWENVDWARTRAYALGFGQVFVNLKGRERDGVVNEGEEYQHLLDSLIIDLMNFHDERSYDRVVANVYKRDEIYIGPYVNGAADLLVSLEPGYRISWQSALGGTPPISIEANMRKWSGDHASADYRTTAGLLIANRKTTSNRPRIIDIAPTVLKHFGLAQPPDLDGAPIY